MSVLSRTVIVVEVKCLSKGDIYQGERNSCRGKEEGSLLHLVWTSGEANWCPCDRQLKVSCWVDAQGWGSLSSYKTQKNIKQPGKYWETGKKHLNLPSTGKQETSDPFLSGTKQKSLFPKATDTYNSALDIAEGQEADFSPAEELDYEYEHPFLGHALILSKPPQSRSPHHPSVLATYSSPVLKSKEVLFVPCCLSFPKGWSHSALPAQQHGSQSLNFLLSLCAKALGTLQLSPYAFYQPTLLFRD